MVVYGYFLVLTVGVEGRFQAGLNDNRQAIAQPIFDNNVNNIQHLDGGQNLLPPVFDNSAAPVFGGTDFRDAPPAFGVVGAQQFPNEGNFAVGQAEFNNNVNTVKQLDGGERLLPPVFDNSAAAVSSGTEVINAPPAFVGAQQFGAVGVGQPEFVGNGGSLPPVNFLNNVNQPQSNFFVENSFDNGNFGVNGGGFTNSDGNGEFFDSGNVVGQQFGGAQVQKSNNFIIL